MAITPQAIKDQEFQSKFRGYDTVEVKAYLELVAEEFFELLEKMRQQEQEISELTREIELGEEIKKNFEDDIEASQRTVEDLRQELVDRDEKIAEMSKDGEEIQTALEDFEQERLELEEEVSAAEGRVSEIDDQFKQSQGEGEGLRNKVKILEEQMEELKKSEVDFKRTIGAAQRFADDLTSKAQEETDAKIAESEERAATAIQAARVEIENLRLEAYASLSRLPEEIEQLSLQRKKIREELRATLTRHLEEVDSYSDEDVEVKQYDYDVLFPSAVLPDADEASGDEDLDNIDMDLGMDESSSSEQEEGSDEGDIAFLSEK
jgi:cell division initiation protein